MAQPTITAKGPTMNKETMSSLLMDAYDLKRAIPKRIQNLPKDNEGTEFTIGELLDDMIETLEQLEA
jgi:hypothetical protein